MPNGVRIEYVQNDVPFDAAEEFVVIYNGSKAKLDLRGWKLVYENMDTNAELHTHHFTAIQRGSFDPGERICLLSDDGTNSFSSAGNERRFPAAHWDIYTDHPLHVMKVPRVRLRLLDESGNLVHGATVERAFDARESHEISIFIGHGRNPQWRLLKDHLHDQHGFKVVAYEVGPRAGLSIKEVLDQMADGSSIAFIVMTGEDIDADGDLHARENVVHELGLFQGRLGFTRAIAMLERGVTEFSNIHGLNQIRFPKDGIRESFGDVLATIRREFQM